MSKKILGKLDSPELLLEGLFKEHSRDVYVSAEGVFKEYKDTLEYGIRELRSSVVGIAGVEYYLGANYVYYLFRRMLETSLKKIRISLYIDVSRQNVDDRLEKSIASWLKAGGPNPYRYELKRRKDN